MATNVDSGGIREGGDGMRVALAKTINLIRRGLICIGVSGLLYLFWLLMAEDFQQIPLLSGTTVLATLGLAGSLLVKVALLFLGVWVLLFVLNRLFPDITPRQTGPLTIRDL